MSKLNEAPNPANSNALIFIKRLKRFISDPTEVRWENLCSQRPPCGLNMGGFQLHEMCSSQCKLAYAGSSIPTRLREALEMVAKIEMWRNEIAQGDKHDES